MRQVVKSNQSAVQKGDPQALFDVALAYIQHKQKNLSANEIDQAIQWLEQASQKNHKESKQLLADFYGIDLSGHRHSIEKSIAIHEEIAEAKDPDPSLLFHLFRHYQDKDQTKALRWLNAAANAGHERAQYTLATAYLDAQFGLGSDEAKALHWLTTSATAGVAEAQYILAKAYFSGLLGLASDQARAVELYRASAQQGVPAGMYEMGHMYDHGHGGLEKDKEMALTWYWRAAQSNHAPAIEKFKQLTEAQ